MKKIWMASVSVIALTALASPALAGSLYIAGGGGIATGFDRDFDHDGLGPPKPSSVFHTGDQHFGGGPVFEAAVGFDTGTVWSKEGALLRKAGLRFELQASYVDYDVDGIAWQESEDSPSSAPPPGQRTGHMDTTLLMLNVLVDFDLGLGGLTPYVGVGVGGAFSELNSGGQTAKSAPPFLRFDEADDSGIAWQVLVGASAPVSTNLDVYANYRLLGLPELDMTSTHPAASTVEFDDELSHLFTFGVRYTFGP